MKKELATLMMAVAALAACTPQEEEQQYRDSVIETLTQEQQKQITKNFDDIILREFDAGKPMAEAHKAACRIIPSKKQNLAVHYLLERHADMRFQQAFDKKTYSYLVGLGSCSTFEEKTQYTWRKEFVEQLRKEYQARKVATDNVVVSINAGGGGMLIQNNNSFVDSILHL